MKASHFTPTQKQIYELLAKRGNLKSIEIAKALSMNEKTVNSALYSEPLFGACERDKNTFRWKLKNIASTDMPNPVPDEKLVDLCKYYLDCIESEGGTSVSVFQQNNFGLNYREITNLDILGEDNNGASQFVRTVCSSSDKVAYIGYPLLFSSIHSNKQNEDYRKIFPLFLFPVEFNGGNIQISDTPSLNNEVVAKYSESDSVSSMQETINLENELGFGGNEVPKIDELMLHLRAIRPNWEWMEEINPDKLSLRIKVEDIESEGIYNKAIVLSTDRPAYTLGLENELSQLAKVDEKTYRESALYKLLHHEYKENDIGEEKQILEVLPLNTEQRDAIQSALVSDITVITGPPGTGKSQVVTDLLVNMAISGKSVLFASKNNKAVDVVNARVNGLGKKPIMLRFTSAPAPEEFAHMLEKVIASSASITEEEYKSCLGQYNSLVDEYKKLESRKSEMINSRNELDKIEQRYCMIRNDYSKYYGYIDTIDTSLIDKELQVQRQSFDNACKQKQNFFIKMFWFVFSKGRTEAFNLKTEKINNLLSPFEITRNSALDETEQRKFEDKVKEFSRNVSLVQEYKERLERLGEIESLELIDYKLMELSRSMREKALELWDLWLTSRKYKLDQAQKEQMQEFIIAAKLMAGESSMGASTGSVATKFKMMQSNLAQYFPCWAVTSLSSKGRIPFRPAMFDLLVIDEASQCDIASIIPLLYRAKRVAVIGDPMQLSHITALTNKQDIMMIEKYGVDLKWSYSSNSFFGLVNSMVSGDKVVRLKDHHRSHSDIISFSNTEFYDDTLRIATDYKRFKIPENYKAGIDWIDVAGKAERPKNGSAINKAEINAIKNELRSLVIDSKYLGTIGVVSPFRAQADRIREEVEKDKELKEALSKNDFLVDTVHKFQGDEKDIMFFSPVISDGVRDGAISFLNSTGNLFNVAITRARSLLIVVGNRQYCRNCGISYMEHFVNYVDTLGSSKEEEKSIGNYGSTYPSNIDDSVVSDWEKIFYEALYKAGISTTPQYPEDKYKLDLALFANGRKLDIEIDGEMYHKSWNGELCYRDKLRNQRLYELGWEVKRFWVYQIRDDLESCVQQIKEWEKVATN